MTGPVGPVARFTGKEYSRSRKPPRHNVKGCRARSPGSSRKLHDVEAAFLACLTVGVAGLTLTLGAGDHDEGAADSRHRRRGTSGGVLSGCRHGWARG